MMIYSRLVIFIVIVLGVNGPLDPMVPQMFLVHAMSMTEN